MKTTPHPTFQENLAAYALGALEAAEVAALASHLSGCAACRAELAAFQRLGEGLLLALPPQAPRSGLRRAVAARLPGGRSAARRSRRLPAFSFARLAVGAAFLLLLGINLLSVLQVQALRREQAEMARQLESGQIAIGMLAYPETEMLPISGEGVAGTLLANRQRKIAVLLTWDLPTLEQGQTYQIWLISPDGERVSGGLFLPQRDQAYTLVVVQLSGPPGEYVGLGVTVEPAGGSPAPTTPPVLTVEF